MIHNQGQAYAFPRCARAAATGDVVLFGDTARELPISGIAYVQVGPEHTNTKAGLQLAQQILRRRRHNSKQIFMITDGKPSALTENGRLYTHSFGLDMKIVNRTLEEETAAAAPTSPSPRSCWPRIRCW